VKDWISSLSAGPDGDTVSVTVGVPEPPPPTAQDYEMVPVDRLLTHPDNARRGDLDTIRESIRANGFYGACVVQRSTGRILVGNHRYLAAVEEGLTEVPVVWVDKSDEEARRLLLVDNRSTDLAVYDDEALVALLVAHADDGGLIGTGFSDHDLDEILAAINEPLDPGDNKYASQILAPVYHPTGENPAVADLRDTGYAETLRTEIEAAALDDDLRRFLLSAAERHTVFNFALIAEFYAHADAEVQHLMERSGLVIIDFDKAVENGFVSMSEILADLAGQQRT
jgi:hypothetical protein